MKIIAIANRPRTPAGFLLFAKNIRARLDGNPLLPDPNPTLADFGADVDLLDQAQTNASDRTPEAVAERNARALRVYRQIGHIIVYVQGVADSQISAADAIAVILSAGLKVKKSSTHAKRALAAKYSGISGQVWIVALAIAGAGAYYWEYSLDQAVWMTEPETTVTKALITGLTPGLVYYFRFRVLTNQGKSDYSQVVSLRVH